MAVRLVLSCGAEFVIADIARDAWNVKEGDIGLCAEHEDATVDAMFVEEDRKRLARESE